MSDALDALANAEANVAAQVQAAVDEITGLKMKVADLEAKLATPPDESAVTTVTDKLNADADKLKAAVAPNG